MTFEDEWVERLLVNTHETDQFVDSVREQTNDPREQAMTYCVVLAEINHRWEMDNTAAGMATWQNIGDDFLTSLDKGLLPQTNPKRVYHDIFNTKAFGELVPFLARYLLIPTGNNQDSEIRTREFERFKQDVDIRHHSLFPDCKFKQSVAI